MTCQEVQSHLSLYLYGELDFALEELCEQHLDECPFCQLKLNSEKNWHAALNAQQHDVPLNLLADCRNELGKTCDFRRVSAFPDVSWLKTAGRLFGVRTTPWSLRFAAASLLVMLGFSAERIANSFHLLDAGSGNMAEISFAESPVTRIQNVRPVAGNRVKILVEQVRNGEVDGSPNDERVRNLLMAGARESVDPGIRVDAVEMLFGQNGQDVRDALIQSVQNDPNAAVRMKALEGLRPFSADSATRDALKFVLAHDANAEVRSEAIDVLVPADRSLVLTPQLLGTLQDVFRDGQNDEYVRTRCLQVMEGSRKAADAY